ncbi:MAG: hypothetical protein CM15mV22_2450 [Eurybiavirus sp.]|nr:MAG: hypothetical protein CM15mV22_2450 [Eurybiavirus sp.]
MTVLGYAHGNDTLHERLVSCMKKSKAKWLFIHSDNDFYRDALSDIIYSISNLDMHRGLVRIRTMMQHKYPHVCH